MRNMLPVGSRYCECSACGRFFNSPGGFDQHRSGPYSDRACLDPIELGMVLNDKGYWMNPWPDSRVAFYHLRKAKTDDISGK